MKKAISKERIRPCGGMKRMEKDLSERMEGIRSANQKTRIINKLAT